MGRVMSGERDEFGEGWVGKGLGGERDEIMLGLCGVEREDG